MKPLLFLLAAGLFTSALALQAQESSTIESPECAGMSGFRAHWDSSIPVAENGTRLVKDAVVKDRGQTAAWNGAVIGPVRRRQDTGQNP